MAREAGDNPADHGFAMPAEWMPHARCWMMWPTRRELWDDFAATKRNTVAVARAIRLFEPVTVMVRPEQAAEARALLGAAIDILEIPIDDSWARDVGPCFLVDGRGGLAGADFRFNAWGGKYAGYENDNLVAGRVLEAAGAGRFASSLVAEGGGITVDGEGTVITTESCFPNANRNADWSRAEIEAELKRALGARKVIWIPGNPDERETDGHVDGIAAFVRPGVVLVEVTDDPDQPHHAVMQENLKALRAATDAKGRALEIVVIKDAAEAESDCWRFCRSYVNAYIANGAVVMPCYGIDADRAAMETFQRVYPERKIVPVAIDDIAVGGGGIHCITQQQPRV